MTQISKFWRRAETLFASKREFIPQAEKAPRRMKIWIDLDNSPHVPFFAPIIRELEKLGHSVFLTSRDCFQVRELTELLGLHCKMVGRHWGRNKFLKVLGACVRALRLAGSLPSQKPDLALSHGSRSQVLAATLLQIPTLMIDDYEFSTRGINPDWLIVPEVIPSKNLGIAEERVRRYPGIKEDVYLAKWKPDAGLRDRLGLNSTDIVVTVRPPASDAHYHNAEGDVLYRALMDYLLAARNVRVVVLPRGSEQAAELSECWKDAVDRRQLLIPDRAIDGLSLIWFSDLVISGGGTMNREAASMGVPVYSIFRGPMGAVDRDLAAKGKLVFVNTVEEIRSKILPRPRPRPSQPLVSNGAALQTIVDNVISLAALSHAS